MRDVALAAGVSLKTVSRVHNSDPNVAPATRERVEAAMKELGYLPNALATTFRQGTSPLVGVVVPSLTDHFFASLVQAIDATVAGADLMTVVAAVADPSDEQDRVEALLNRRLSGLVIAPSSHDHSYLAPWTAQLPIVFVDRPPEGLDADVVLSDDVQATEKAVAHLAANGHTHIGFIGNDAAITTTQERLRGYRQGLGAAGLAEDPELIKFHGDDPALAPTMAETMLAASPPASAVICSNARAAMALGPHLASIPIAVISFGDFPLADALTPSVAALDQHPTQIGTEAARRLLARIDDPDGAYDSRVTVGTTLVPRDSSARKGPAADHDRAQD
ncbi:LacI family DNA-binding transcriptional regulator [Demequina flava]|uniref:LacI family DNA-binding transcriptional regulator n=1 Tax=Demequina flava TaxID=1095025 RepID=UPI0007835D05|nr:LacI family DNA-binding transcriptional regulator [Demequina flava]